VFSVSLLYRRAGEPLIVRGNLLLGSAAQFSQNAVKFLHAAHHQYGDVFTIRLVNQYLTIVMDPHSYEAVSREKNFDFDPIQKQVIYSSETVCAIHSVQSKFVRIMSVLNCEKLLFMG